MVINQKLIEYERESMGKRGPKPNPEGHLPKRNIKLEDDIWSWCKEHTGLAEITRFIYNTPSLKEKIEKRFKQ